MNECEFIFVSMNIPELCVKWISADVDVGF